MGASIGQHEVNRRRLLGGVGALGVVGAAHLTAPAGAFGGPVSAGGVAAPLGPRFAQDWVQTCYDLTWREGPSPTNAARCYAYLALGMYEACVAGMPKHRSLGGQLTGLGRLPVPRGRIDWPTALAASAHGVSTTVYSTAAPERLAGLTLLRDNQIAERRASGIPATIIARSASHGRAVGAALADWISRDGHAEIQGLGYTPPVGDSLWVSTPPNYRPAIEPYWSRVRPLMMSSADEVAPAAPLPFSTDPSSAFHAQAMVVLETSRALTDDHRAIARFWTDNPLLSGLPSGHWMLIVSQVATAQRLSLAQALEAYVRLGVGLHEAFLSCWTAKYRLNLLRPVTYINRHIDPAFTTFVNTPQFPEYTSGHSVASRAASTVLTDLLGQVAFVDDSHRDRAMPARSYTSFTAAADEAAQSRIYGGIHFPMGIEEGKSHGDAVGRLVLQRLHTRR